jgi:sterol 3beta-glucosyltransferase
MLDFAEGRNIPAVYAPLHAMHPTRAFPSPFFAPLGPRLDSALNPLTYCFIRGMPWQIFRPVLNRWRQRAGLRPHGRTGYFRWMRARHIPVVCGFSREVLPEPADWPGHQRVTGYWFWDEPRWQPPAALEAFLAAGPPPVSIGFGSMDDQDPARLTRVAVQALNLAGQRGILIGGSGGLGGGDLPDNVYRVEAVPHSWLFPRVAAVVHHGGAGTTAAGLRAGVPAVITPVAGDQPFWAARLAQMGVGLQGEGFGRLTAAGLAGHICQAIEDTTMRERAAALGRRIRAEDGVGHAVRLINRWADRAPAQGMGLRD